MNRLDPSPAPSAADLEEEEAMRKARKRAREELEAFQDIMNYNADVAYGIDTPREE